MVDEVFKIQGLPAEKVPGVTVGIFPSMRPWPEKQVRLKDLKSTLGRILGSQEVLTASAAGGTLIWGWDKPSPRSKLQRNPKYREERPIRQNTLFFTFRGLDNGVNLRCIFFSVKSGEGISR